MTEFESADFREVFTLKENETIALAGTNVSVTLRRLIYSPCVLVTKCDWDGRAMHLRIAEGDTTKNIELVSQNFSWKGTDYILGLVQSDFKTEASFAFFPSDTKLVVSDIGSNERIIKGTQS